MTCIHRLFDENGRRRGAAGHAVIWSLFLSMFTGTMSAQAQVVLADQPVFAGGNVPGNLALTLSVEFPTAISVANLGNYVDNMTFAGYFDPVKCYTYMYNSATPAASYFQPTSFATGPNSHQCTGLWSGNFMNWATMQTIDPFRWALSGGYRSVDQAGLTILEKAWAPDWYNPAEGNNPQYSRGSLTNFPYRGTSQGSPNTLTTAVSTVTPFSWSNFNSSILWRGNMMVFSGSGTGYTYYQYNPNGAVAAPNTYHTYYPLNASQIAASSTPVSGGPPSASPAIATNGPFYDYNGSAVAGNTYRVYVRVKVCDPTTSMGVAGLEANCVKYGNNYKPEGLLQQYASQVRYAVFGYLDGNGMVRQGGVLRRPMNYIGPTYTPPLTSTPVTNGLAEWDPTTGIQNGNPDSTDATASGVTKSGVINYLNSFGESSQTYMIFDDVSELYYAAVRYFENLGNVPEWTNAASSNELDGFPALTTWKDPILYSCQKNFILGIGDDHTNFDYNVGGGTVTDPNINRPKPTAVSNDAFNQAGAWTTDLQNLEGINPTPWWTPGSNYATYYIAGLAYGAHIQDLRSDLTGSQTISTYWMDVEEGGYPENLNPYYLATKYGGFNVPSGYTIANTTPLTSSWWNTSNSTIQMGAALNYTQGLPANYFLAGNATNMVSSLTSAFTNIVNSIQAYTTAFSFATNSVTTSTESFSSEYSSGTWTSVITASTLSFDSGGNATATQLWQTSTTLQTQLAGTGWQTNRRVATWNGSAGVPFEVANLTSAQLTALLPSYSSGPTAATAESNYLSYLRGDRTNEVGSTATNSTKSLRARSLLLGDIVDAALTPVGAPSQVFSDASNPGYAAFMTQWTNRPTMVYAAANDGMLHAFVGSSGTEQFAYVPSATFQGPTATPQVNGLAALGNPNFTHHYYVDATPLVYDIDLGHTGGTTGSPNWHSLLIGGLGKGGKSYYAIDVTNPSGMTSEAIVAGNVKWEYTDSATMGYSFGAPVVVKTAQWGWVVALTSGYNSGSSLGYLYLINPATGALIQRIATPSASSGLTQASAYVQNYSDDTADSIYVGDLNGQLWRFDLTATSGPYPAPTLLATLTDAAGNQQPITTAPLIEISPTTRRRYVLVGTGQLLSTSDIINANMQTFYAIIDGTAGAFNAVSTPINRAALTPVSSTSSGVTLSATSKGWYFDLGVTGNIAWRVVVNPVAYNGIVGFTALLTSGTDPCQPTGQSEVYAVNYSNATSVLTNQAPNDPIAGAVNSEKVFLNNGNATFEVGTQAGGPFPVPWNPQVQGSTRLLNWREIPTAE
jgi:type IV pilus assembly protein PilY1